VLAHASLNKESSKTNAAKRAPASQSAGKLFVPEEQLEASAPPKFSWSLDKIQVSSPGENSLPPPGGNGNGPASMPRSFPLAPPFQAKLKMGVADDPLEREADRLAEKVMRMTVAPDAAAPVVSPAVSGVQRRCSCDGSSGDKCAKCTSDDKEKMLQRSASAPAADFHAPPSAHDVLRSPGEPLDAATRAFMEPRFRHDFSAVRVHTDEPAAQSAQAIQARAFTVGRDIVFGAGQFAPKAPVGQQLLAHELTHVVQADAAASNSARPPSSIEALEREARQASAGIRGAVPPIQGLARNLSVPLREGPHDPDAPTYGNLPVDAPEHAGSRRVELINEGGKWIEKAAGRNAPIRTAKGSYDFVVQDGRIFAVRSSGRFGHTEAAKGGRVTWAGRIAFTQKGALKSWDNASGHYLPQGSFAKNAELAHPDLTIDKFVPTHKGPVVREAVPGGRPAHKEGPQLPVFQPTKGPPPPPVGKTNEPPPAPVTPSRGTAKPVTPSPGATPSKASTQKPTKATTNIAPSGHGAGGGSKTVGAVSSTATHAVGAAFQLVHAEMKKITHDSGDKDLNAALDVVDKALDVKSFVQNPTGYAASAIKSGLIQGVFNHFSSSLDAARQKFTQKFPDVAALHKDPLGTGVSLEGYEKAYNQAVAALRLPDAWKAAVYVSVLLGTNEKTPAEEIERRIGIANEMLGRLPGLGEYVKKYQDARGYYGFAMLAVSNRLRMLGDDLAKQPAGVAAELRRRGNLLYKAGAALNDASDQLCRSGMVVFVPVLDVAMDLETLGKGFDGLSKGFHEFADLVGGRNGEYDQEIKRIEEQGAKMAAVAAHPF
jgi:hypothetical protein